MKQLVLFSTFLITLIAQSQTKHILILDSLTKQSLPDVEMQTQNGSLFSDEEGIIEIENLPESQIIIAHPDYATKYLVFSEKLDTVLLVRKKNQLAEVAVQVISNKDKYYELGYYHIKKRYQIHCGINVPDCIVATFIQAPTEKVYIDEILLHMNQKQYAKKYTVYLYKPDKSGIPGEILYKKTIATDSLKKEGVINIHKLFIKIPKNGIFIGLENCEPYNPDNAGIRYYGLEGDNFNKIAYITRNDKELNPSGIWSLLNEPGIINYTPCFGLRVYHK